MEQKKMPDMISSLRLEIYNSMKEKGIRHYIVTAYRMDEHGRTSCRWDCGFRKCHETDDSFDREIEILRGRGFNYFDVIHLH